MSRAEIYSVISKCFTKVDQELWDELTSSDVWGGFLKACQNELFGGSGKTSSLFSDQTDPFEDLLSIGEAKALRNPPTFEKKAAFAARHFTGGLPESVQPVESLYTVWTTNPSFETAFGQVEGLYLGDPAWYMKCLIERLDMTLPSEYKAYPDHLSIELDLLAILERSGLFQEAEKFLLERFRWLPAYRRRLLQIPDDASFYICLIDVLIGIYSNHALAEEAS